MITFKSSHHDYIYNSGTNEIFRVKDSSVLHHLNHSNSDGVEFRSCTGKDTASIERLIINITEECNLRCSYCVYGDNYFFERQHSERTTDTEIIYKAINLYAKNRSSVSIPQISFYGGEPLLAFQSLVDAVEYGNRELPGCHYSISTNGTLLNEDIIAFLISNSFDVWISLDGPETVHDVNRVDRAGNGTYQVIDQAVTSLLTNFADYFQKHVFFIMTLTPQSHLPSIQQFLYDKPYLHFKNVHLNYLNTINLKNTHNKTLYDIESLYLKFDSIKESYILDKTKVKGQHLGELIVDDYLYKVHNRIMYPDYAWINGCCSPGNNRLFVSCDGSLFPCERAGSFMKIGNIEDGIDAKLVNSYYELFLGECKKTCSHCSIVHLCDFCFVTFKQDQEMNFSNKASWCDRKKRMVKMALEIYVSVLEESPSAFDHLRK